MIVLVPRADPGQGVACVAGEAGRGVGATLCTCGDIADPGHGHGCQPSPARHGGSVPGGNSESMTLALAWTWLPPPLPAPPLQPLPV